MRLILALRHCHGRKRFHKSFYFIKVADEAAAAINLDAATIDSLILLL
jgi:hypothetical protein